MRYRELGRTGLKVSEIGFGTIPILSGNVPVLPEYFSPDEETAVAILRKAFEYGCNFYDTAILEEYGDAEIKLGKFAKTVDRNRIIISDKARFYSGGEIYREVLRSAKNLGTRPDVYFVHQVDEDNADEVFGPCGAVEALYDLKREGKIGYVGIASHYYNVLYRAAKDPRVDVLQGSGNILERGMLERIRQEDTFREKGFILNKVYAAGLLIGPFSVDELIGGILEYPFSCALLGIGTFEQAEMAFAKEYPPIRFSFEEVIDRLRKTFEPICCDRCQKCVCPYGHEIHTAFRQYNYYCLGKEFWAIRKLQMDLEQTY
ncbi:MAG: aldo/keto reductase, partial [Lachnospiraceae bacterium]|nr:aldo/keto reductase [Lachnospiraceae bacterium]